jgi:hypothetical protein
MVAAHRVQRYVHGLRLLFFHVDDFAALVVAAIRTNPVRQDRFVALRAILDLHGFEMLVAPPFALAGVRGPSLRDCHG